jgi:hypothetical protein
MKSKSKNSSNCTDSTHSGEKEKKGYPDGRK